MLCSRIESRNVNLTLTGPDSKLLVSVFCEAVLGIDRLLCLYVLIYCKDIGSNQGIRSTLACTCRSWQESEGRIFLKM